MPAPCDPTGVPLTQQVLHDAGPLFVPKRPQALGDRVELRVWQPRSWPLQAIALRTVVDGEIFTQKLTVESEEPGGHWWSTTLTITNPVMPYRFCLTGREESDRRTVPSYAWLTAAGIVPWDVSDATDFRLVTHPPAPDWVDDAVVYQVFPDRFARSTAAPLDAEGRPTPEHLPSWAQPMRWEETPSLEGEINGHQLYGGDLDGIIERLDYISALGANTVYLTPVFPAGSVHRYDASTFDHVDPLLGGDEALVRLSRALHERGMRLMLDLTTNHTGDGHEWFRTAQADPHSPEASFYRFTEHPHRYRCWLGVPSLPSLDHSSPLLRTRLLAGPGSVVGRYLTSPFNADGWRIDVANMTGRDGADDHAHAVARTIRATMREVTEQTGRETWLLAEHGHDASGDLAGDGWHGTMNYTGFTRPLWAWLADPSSGLNWLGLPTTIPSLPGWAAGRTLREYSAHLSWEARCHSQNQLASHDTPRLRSVVGDAGRHRTAFAALTALPGVPTIFAGEELGLHGTTGERSRTPMPWKAISRITVGESVTARTAIEADVDPTVLPQLRSLLHLRRDQEALRRGGLIWLHLGEDSMVFLRSHPEAPVLVHLARAAHDPVALDLRALPGQDAAHAPEALFSLGPVGWSLDGDSRRVWEGGESQPRELVFTADGPGASFLHLAAMRPAASAQGTPSSSDG